METSFDRELIGYFTLLDEKQKETILAMIKSFIEPQRITIEQYNKEIDEANERIEKGEFITVEELKKEAQSW